MDLDRVKQVAVTALRSIGRAGTVLKTNPAAGLVTALAAGFLAGRLLRRKDTPTALEVRAK
jgi:hypothetical protein